MKECNAQNLANIVWAFAEGNQSDVELFAVFACEAQRRANEFKEQNLANITWAFAEASQSDGELLAALASEMNLQNVQHLANITWAFATVM